MADDADRAQEINDQHLAEAFYRQAAASRGDNLTALTCVDCGEEIPPARRRAVPGCKRCVNCQTCEEGRS